MNKTKKLFHDLNPDDILAFSTSSRSDNQYLTHGYHRYPAKFIPSLASYLINKNSKKGDLICDPFGGCGTSLVEAKINGRESIGIDINPVAGLITKTKTTSINPQLLRRETDVLFRKIESKKIKNDTKLNISNDRLNYWFPKENLEKLSIIYFSILEFNNKNLRRFYLCAFSQILKNSSKWLMSSIKPQVDKKKNISDPFISFRKHVLYMNKKNEEFYSKLLETNNYNIKSKFYLRDARKTFLDENSIDYIITSPPYVTSYEYADLHELSILWLENIRDWREFKSKFIGTSNYKKNKHRELYSEIGHKIIDDLMYNDRQLARGVKTYYEDMGDFIKESRRILKKGKKVSLVIGNTILKGVEILNAEVAYEQMEQLGFKNIQTEKRRTSFQSITPYRDKISGRFTSASSPNKRRAYEYEFIITATK